MDLAERRANSRRHPWELARSDHFRQVIREATAGRSIRRLLDIGAGDRWFAQELVNDLSPPPPSRVGTSTTPPTDLNAVLPSTILRTTERPTGVFDLVLMLDVLEHIELDEQFLETTVLPLLAGNGTLIVSVPAYQMLFSAHDVALGHFRRYRPRRIYALLGRHLRIVRHGSLFTSVLPLRGAQVAAECFSAKRSSKPDTAAPTGIGPCHARRSLTHHSWRFAAARHAQARRPMGGSSSMSVTQDRTSS
jgi:hypothetical protein